MSIKWKVILVIFPSTLLAFYGACALWTGLSSSYSELVAALVTAPAFWCIIATGVMAERYLRATGQIGPMFAKQVDEDSRRSSGQADGALPNPGDARELSRTSVYWRGASGAERRTGSRLTG
jgi:hypothetical protein